MTYKELKDLTAGIGSGDFVMIPKSEINNPDAEARLLQLLKLALYQVAMSANSLRLTTTNKEFTRVRGLTNDTFIREPKIPEGENKNGQIIDIDHELGYAVAYYLASLKSKSRPEYFKQEAMNIIEDYNTKIALDMENITLNKENKVCTL